MIDSQHHLPISLFTHNNTAPLLITLLTQHTLLHPLAFDLDLDLHLLQHNLITTHLLTPSSVQTHGDHPCAHPDIFPPLRCEPLQRTVQPQNQARRGHEEHSSSVGPSPCPRCITAATRYGHYYHCHSHNVLSQLPQPRPLLLLLLPLP